MSPQITNTDKRDQEIEDYPCPLAVVGVSVLLVNHFSIFNMLWKS